LNQTNIFGGGKDGKGRYQSEMRTVSKKLFVHSEEAETANHVGEMLEKLRRLSRIRNEAPNSLM